MSSNTLIVSDTNYNVPTMERLTQLRRSKPWEMDPEYFKKIQVNASAAVKMLQHALQGVVSGKKATGMSVEVMGLLLGYPNGDSVVVTDCIQLPIEGMENRIEAPAEVQAFMTQMVEITEMKRQERILGWYHSHPFELIDYSHCHMSSTDVQTQQAFQATTPWWTAIVIDPIRSLHQGNFEFGAYRCYPPTMHREDGLAPDNTKSPSMRKLREKWGIAPHRYYSLQVEYWLSSDAAVLLSQTMDFTNWSKPLLQNTLANFSRMIFDLNTINSRLKYMNAVLDPCNEIKINKNIDGSNSNNSNNNNNDGNKKNQFAKVLDDDHSDDDNDSSNNSHNYSYYNARAPSQETIFRTVSTLHTHQLHCQCGSWMTPKLLQLLGSDTD